MEEVSLAEQLHLAIEYGIWSMPALIINGRLAFTGPVQQGALAEKLTNLLQTDQAPEELGGDTLQCR